MFDIVELLMPWLRVLMGSVIVLEHWKFGLFTEGLDKHVHWWSCMLWSFDAQHRVLHLFCFILVSHYGGRENDNDDNVQFETGRV